MPLAPFAAALADALRRACPDRPLTGLADREEAEHNLDQWRVDIQAIADALRDTSALLTEPFDRDSFMDRCYYGPAKQAPVRQHRPTSEPGQLREDER